MTTDVYQPPESEIIPESPIAESAYYVVAPKKFLILFFATMGMYEVYWFYRQWQSHRTQTGQAMWPVMRAIFSIFFTHSLFRIVDSKLVEKGRDLAWSVSHLATGYVVLSIADSVASRLSMNEVGEPYTDLFAVVVLPAIGWILYKAQLAFNQISDDPDGQSNSELSGANYAWIVFGGIFWLLIFVGLYDVMFGINW